MSKESKITTLKFLFWPPRLIKIPDCMNRQIFVLSFSTESAGLSERLFPSTLQNPFPVYTHCRKHCLISTGILHLAVNVKDCVYINHDMDVFLRTWAQSFKLTRWWHNNKPLSVHVCPNHPGFSKPELLSNCNLPMFQWLISKLSVRSQFH